MASQPGYPQRRSDEKGQNVTTETERGTAAEDEPQLCGSGRMVGSWDLECELPPGHEEDGTWHLAHLHERRRVESAHLRHVVESTETIEWEPGDIKRALRSLLDRRRASNA
jgi:hypothetical protein